MTTTTAAISLNDAPARMGIESIELGQRWAAVMPEAERLYAAEPTCEARKIARKNSRRAYLLETCTYSPASATFADLPVSSIRHYFVDQVLLRIDVAIAGSESDLQGIAAIMSAKFGESMSTAADADAMKQWQVDRDEAAIRMAGSGMASDAGSVSTGAKVSIEDVANGPAEQAQVTKTDEAITAGEPEVLIYLRDIRAAGNTRALTGW